MFNKEIHQYRETSSGLTVLHEIRKLFGIIPIFKWTKQVECLETRRRAIENKMNRLVHELHQAYQEWDENEDRIKLAKSKIKNSSDDVPVHCSDWFDAGKDKDRKKYRKSPKGKASKAWRNPVGALLNDIESEVESYGSLEDHGKDDYSTEVISEHDQEIGQPVNDNNKNRRKGQQQQNNNQQQG